MAHNFFVFLWYPFSGFIWVFTSLVHLFIGLSAFFILSKSHLIFYTFLVVSVLFLIWPLFCPFYACICCIDSVLLLMCCHWFWCFLYLQGHLRVSCFPCIVSFLNLQFHSGETGSHPHSPGRPQWMWKFPDFPCWDYRHGPPHWDLYFWPSTWSFSENAEWTWMCTLQLQQTFCKCSSASEYGSTQSSHQSEVPSIIILEYILPLEIIFALNIWWFHLR